MSRLKPNKYCRFNTWAAIGRPMRSLPTNFPPRPLHRVCKSVVGYPGTHRPNSGNTYWPLSNFKPQVPSIFGFPVVVLVTRLLSTHPHSVHQWPDLAAAPHSDELANCRPIRVWDHMTPLQGQLRWGDAKNFLLGLDSPQPRMIS